MQGPRPIAAVNQADTNIQLACPGGWG